MYRLLRFALPLILLMASTAAQAVQCSQSGRYSVAEFDRLIAEVQRVSGNGSLPDCAGNNWYTCKAVDDLVWTAIEHLDQVFRGQALGPNGRCLNCEMHVLVAKADVVAAWAEWLYRANYKYRGAYGNLAETFRGYSGLPMCSSGGGTPPLAPRPSAAARCPLLVAFPPLARERPFSLELNDNGKTTFGRSYLNFYYHPDLDVYCGYGTGTSSELAMILRQQANNWVQLVHVNDRFQDVAYYNLTEYENDAKGNYTAGVRRNATTGQQVGFWLLRWQ